MKLLLVLLSIFIGSVLGATKVCKDVVSGHRPQIEVCPYQILVDEVSACISPANLRSF